MEFLVDVFTENGHERSNLEAIARNYVLPENRANQSSSSDPSEPKQRFVKIPWIPKIGPKLRRISRVMILKQFLLQRLISRHCYATINQNFQQIVMQGYIS
jgi:hypothetical protein